MHPAVAQSALAPRRTGLARYVVASVAGHALLAGVAFLVSLISRPPPLDLNQTPIKASLVRLGKPRDPKLLPRKEEEPPPPPPKAEDSPPPPTPAPPEPPAVAVPIPGVKPKPAPASKKHDGAPAPDVRKQLFGALSKATRSTKPEELEGQADGDPDGDAAKAEGDRYWGLLSAQVKRHYDVSQTISETERLHLEAYVRIRIGRSGELLQAELVKSSGNELFDNAVMTALKKTAPFSPPPETLRDMLQKSGQKLRFSP